MARLELVYLLVVLWAAGESPWIGTQGSAPPAPTAGRPQETAAKAAPHDLTQRQGRRLIGRHVCAHNKVVMHPVKDLQSYCKPSYRSYLKRCDKDSSQYCTGYRVAYELAYRTVQRYLAKTESVYSCCPGWTSSRTSASDCKKALCTEACRNGGVCSKPDRCACPAGWTGRTCEEDVDECASKKDICHHLCVNVPGSYKCECQSNYVLQRDRKSCKKTRTRAIETSEENDDMFFEKIKILEKRMRVVDELGERLESLTASVQKLLSRTDTGDRSDPGGGDAKCGTKDQIESLSDQIAILEERLAECSCNKKEFLLLPQSQK